MKVSISLLSVDLLGEEPCVLICILTAVPTLTEKIRKLRLCTNAIKLHFLAKTLANQGTKWHFIPPASPHWDKIYKATPSKNNERSSFNIWRALYAVSLGRSYLSFRYLRPSSSDPAEHNALTPPHFLNGDLTVCIPDKT